MKKKFILVFFSFIRAPSSKSLLFTEQLYSTYFVKGQKENGSKVAVWEVL